MQASQGDKATFKLSMLETGFYDHSIYEVFVFDGDNFMEGEYIGRLSRLLKLINFRSDSSSFTFLNLYRTPSTSYVFGNDWSKVKDLAQYNTWVIDPIKETKGYLYNMENKDDAYYTFFCDECTSFYIESLLFDPSISNDSLGYLEVSGMSPTQRLPPILNYTISQFTNSSLPQLISSSIATFHTHKCGIVLKLRLDEKSDWFSTASDKKRTVFSPNLWNPDAEPNFDYTFSDPFKVYNFSINLESVRLVNDGDVLDVEVGSVDGLTTLYRKYTKTSMSNVPIAGVGRYLNLKLAGSKSSEVILNFEMIDQDIGQSTKRDEKITSVIPGSVTTPSENTHVSATTTATAQVTSTSTSTQNITAPKSTSSTVIIFKPFF
uniref:Uncharacterized protein n=2 Tax=Caenorhabditis japonica TaxID=281687 RepID=A0A8R1I5N4_CAEJA